MLKYCLKKWDENKELLERELHKIDIKELEYLSLVKKTIDIILNHNHNGEFFSDGWNVDKITQIDDGDYQGTLLFLIPIDTYQPFASDYLMTYVEYGSCSGCDTLQSIQSEFRWYDNPEEGYKELMMLCKDIICNIIKPYNGGWRYDERFEQVEYEQEN